MTPLTPLVEFKPSWVTWFIAAAMAVATAVCWVPDSFANTGMVGPSLT